MNRIDYDNKCYSSKNEDSMKTGDTACNKTLIFSRPLQEKRDSQRVYCCESNDLRLKKKIMSIGRIFGQKIIMGGKDGSKILQSHLNTWKTCNNRWWQKKVFFWSDVWKQTFVVECSCLFSFNEHMQKWQIEKTLWCSSYLMKCMESDLSQCILQWRKTNFSV